jgi:hypothetical protein
VLQGLYEGQAVTIREHFQRFVKRVTYIVVAGALLVFVLIHLQYPHLTRLQNVTIGLLGGLPLAALLIVFFRGRFKCPRCGADFQKLRRAQVGRSATDHRMYWELWDACPNCGVSFNEPYSRTAKRQK